MLFSLVRASLGAECAEFMLKGSKGCKEGLSEYATVEEGIKATSSDCYNIFIGIDNQVVKLSSHSNAKGVSFNGCSANKLGLTYEFDKTDVKPNVAFNSFNVSLSAESNVAFENLTLFKSDLVSTNVEKITSNDFYTDYDSLMEISKANIEVNSLHAIFPDRPVVLGSKINNTQFSSYTSNNSTEIIEFTGNLTIDYVLKNGDYYEGQILDHQKNITFVPRTSPGRLQLPFLSTDFITVDNQFVSSLEVLGRSEDDVKINVVFPNKSYKKGFIPTLEMYSTLNVGQIIGVTICCLLVITLILLCIFIARCEKRQAEKELAAKCMKDE